MKTLLIDYGSGNLHSAAKALQATGYTVTISADPTQIDRHDLLVLPGQGHFGQVMRSFEASGFEEGVRRHIAAGKPFLGICVGMQILFEGSEEAPTTPGLGLVPGRLARFQAPRVPQMGWNTVEYQPPFAQLSGRFFYFVHSYYAPLVDGSIGITDYSGTRFTALYARANVVAPQFHPEKSGAVGLALLGAIRRYFADRC
ncbi:imidazole glycerol phosphate synthase subunit HisH [Meiothermus sp. CFH 77666]|uniref:imidazole glycerol phosphate synthase subunit HisH n=1 Tax=Meiothermus sp. CFH 77666 TaxID=2817942 RepID=UPI001AA018B7|nr:imidazole glycerol phosphate synthase subunit HisH [Meiothermus sp. CFH 77666]MBO1438743.1 imidazole glycerol phosphate synthase subunit HisH [Meiothermus sp. CFH 77666]